MLTAPVRPRIMTHQRAAANARRWPAVAAMLILACTATIAAACGNARTAYSVSVVFNDRYTDAGGQAVDEAIHAYDAHAAVLMQETFPPIAKATVHTNIAAFCDAFRQRLVPRSEIARIDCERTP